MNDNPEPPVRLVVVDDHEAVRAGVMAKLGAEPWIEVVGGAGSVSEAMTLITSLRPEIAVLDVNLGDGNGIALCRALRATSPTTQCIFHTSTEVGPETAAAAGAVAVVLKQLTGGRLLETVRAVAAKKGDNSTEADEPIDRDL